MKNKQYVLINIFTSVLALSFMCFILKQSKLLISVNNILPLIIVFAFIHIFKCSRQYLLLIESKVHINEFVKVYVPTTFCSIILPYKLGEIYRMYIYGHKIKDYAKGFLIVMVDKFFDALLLLILFIPYEVKHNSSLSIITWLLLCFVIFSVFVYFGFEQTYYYLNRHFILFSNSKRTLYVLNALEKCHKIYIYIKNMIKDRGILLLICTIICWLLEILFIYILNSGKIFDYLNAAFLGSPSDLFKNYIVVALIMFIMTEVIIILKNRRN